MSMPNQSKRQDDLSAVLVIIRKIAEKSDSGNYIYRGEPECHQENPHCGKVSSSLWREYGIEEEHFNIEVVQKEMLNDAKKHIGDLPQDFRTDFTTFPNVTEEDTDEAINFEILTEIQHYGGETNLIDFTTDCLIALFFACDGHHDEDGRVILQKTDEIKNMINYPRNPRHRVIAQKSVFVRPPNGFIEPREDDIVVIPANLKSRLLQHLRAHHGISTETIYNDLHGFIRNQGIHGGAYTRFYKGFACQKREGEATTTIEKRKESEKSIEDYTKAIELKPDLAEAYNNRGLMYNSIREYGNAIADFNTTLELKPDLVEAYYNRGGTYYEQGNYDHAIEDCNIAIRLKPEYPDPYKNRGLAYVKMKEYNRAVEDFNKAIELNPDDADAYNNRGLAYGRNGKHDCAIEDFNRAIDLKPDYALAHNCRGIAYREKGDYDCAIEDFNKAIELNPDYANAYYERWLARLYLREWEKAKADLINAKKMGANFIALFQNTYESVAKFEERNGLKLPDDLAAMLTLP